MSIRLRRVFFPTALVLGVCLNILNVGPAAANEVLVLRSGNAAIGLPDPLVTMLVGPGGAPLSAAPFTSAEFDSACSTTNAIVVQPPTPWLSSLECDPQAKWVGIDVFGTPVSALYCHNFYVETCCIDNASLSFCWVSDDNLGDASAGGPNPDGVYLNGVPVTPSISGGNYATETQSPLTDVTRLLHCGNNRLEVYNRDIGYSVSGVMFSAKIEVVPCATPSQSSTWGTIKSLYR